MEAMKRFYVMDVPDERSNHAEPIPRGGGIAVMTASLFCLLVVGIDGYMILAVVIAAAAAFADDVKSQPVSTRLLAYILAAVFAALSFDGLIFQGLLPVAVDKAISVLLLVAFMNAFNFMDGIDEISVMQTGTMALGFTALTWIVPEL